ncbi:MAG: asparagine synthase (glutamine-hydrolyzing) [Flavobacteriales bacterium]|nr:asparagine synthase (glutamine-hydrolyzing) [Flavobacteriales bacterium]
MCGINGIFHPNNSTFNSSSKIVEMNKALAHRGPDDNGTYEDEHVSLGHQRLAIIDLSTDGHQPFISQDSDYILVYNGELYNYKEVRSKITNYQFKTNTDTEVILAAYIVLGKKCLELFNGMFSFAIWDKQKQELFVARDRVGIKPLYYYQSDNATLFSSELRALLASEDVPRKLNTAVLPEYLQYQTVHAPNTIIKDVKVLLPGHFMLISKGKSITEKYWNPVDYSVKNESNQTENEIKNSVSELLKKSVERRMMADVPYGAFLSGGIDSSLIVGLMSEVSTKPVSTFSVTFDKKEFSEAKYSDIVAKHFKTDHHEIQLTATNFLEELPNALASMDHPSGDGPNSYVVSKATKDAGITMALSGLGGDELFAGYSIFKQTYDLQTKQALKITPHFLRKVVGGVVSSIKGTVEGEKIAEILSLKNISPKSIYPIYRKALLNKQVNSLIGNKAAENIDLLKPFDYKNQLNTLSEVSLYEMHTYMQNTLLRDADQMSMASALEVRVPFLDHELIEYVLLVPDKYKYPKTPKSLLTDSLKGLVPDEVIYRKKMGFVFPWKDWMKDELKEFCEGNVESAENRGLYIVGSCRKLWKAFLNNDPLISWSRIWHIIVLEDWMKRNNIEA